MSAISETLGLDEELSRQIPGTLVADAFFTKLAEFGIVPQDETEQAQYWQLGELISSRQQKVAQHARQSKIQNALAMATKAAGLPEGQGGLPESAQLDAEVASKVAAYMHNPEVFGHGLVLMYDDAQAQAKS